MRASTLLLALSVFVPTSVQAQHQTADSLIASVISRFRAAEQETDKQQDERCIFAPELRYRRNMYCDNKDFAFIIDESPEDLRQKLKIIPVYSISEGCAHLTRGLGRKWEKCVRSDVESLYYIKELVSKIDATSIQKCVDNAHDQSDTVSYKLRYNTLAKCLSSLTKDKSTK